MGVSVLFVACGGKEKGGERAPIQVKTQQVGVSSVYGKQAFSGTIEEVSGASLSFATSGTLKQLNVVEGQTVRSGQLIGVVDATTAQNAYTSAQASLRTAQDSYDRNKQLHDKGLGIVGVSLDNNEADWTTAIKQLQLPWPQMSDLKGWQCEGASLYNIRAIPATILFAPDGTVVEAGLRGEALTKKLKEIYD